MWRGSNPPPLSSDTVRGPLPSLMTRFELPSPLQRLTSPSLTARIEPTSLIRRCTSPSPSPAVQTEPTSLNYKLPSIKIKKYHRTLILLLNIIPYYHDKKSSIKHSEPLDLVVLLFSHNSIRHYKNPLKLTLVLLD
jgi:hypothetical protein